MSYGVNNDKATLRVFYQGSLFHSENKSPLKTIHVIFENYSYTICPTPTSEFQLQRVYKVIKNPNKEQEDLNGASGLQYPVTVFTSIILMAVFENQEQQFIDLPIPQFKPKEEYKLLIQSEETKICAGIQKL